MTVDQQQEIADAVMRRIAMKYGSTTRRDFFVVETVLQLQGSAGGTRGDASESSPEAPALPDLVAEFVDYWTRRPTFRSGCGMCGGIPHSTTCYVGRMAEVLRK